MKEKNRFYFPVILKGIIFFNLLTATLFDGISQTSMFGGNPQHTGLYNTSFPSDLMLIKKWAFKTNGMIFSSAIIANDVIYIGSDDSCLYALNLDGTLKWKFKSNGKIRSTPALKDTVVYFNNFGGKFYAVNTNTGLEIWNFTTDGELFHAENGIIGCTPTGTLQDDPWDFYLSSPVITDTIAYFGSGYNVYAINLNTGNQLWKYVAPKVVHSSPAMYDSIVYFGCWDSKIYAVDAFTGVEKWTLQTGVDKTAHLMEGIQSSPTIVDSFVYIGSRDAFVYACHTKTGKIIWKTSFGGSWMPSSFAVLNDTVYTGSSDYRSLFAMDKFTGNIKYSLSTNCYDFSTPVVSDETVFMGCMNGSLFAIDLNTRKIKCRFDTDGRKKNSIHAIRSDGSLNPAVFNPVSTSNYSDAVEFVRRVLTAGSILSIPSIHDSVVYFGSSDSCIYAIYDPGNCKPKTQVKTKKIDLGLIDPSVSVDTSFYISNSGECPDSMKVYPASNTYSIVQKATTIDPKDLTISGGDSMKIQVTINPSGLKAITYNLYLTIQSKSNEYNYFNTLISFQPDVVSSISNTNKNQTDIIYPNPFRDFISVKMESGSDISIINVTGTTVFQKKITKNVSQIDLSNLPNGMFLVIIYSNDKFYTSKLLKCN